MESTRKAFAPGVDLPLEGEDGMVRHYGDPAAEYGFVRGAVGVVERRDLAQLKMFGRDPVRMLNGLITNDLGRASAGQAVYGAVLTPKGRVITDLRVMKTSDDPPELLIDHPRTALPAFREHLQKYVPPLFARWADAETEAIGVYGPLAPEVLAKGLGITAATTEDSAATAVFEGEMLRVVGSAVAGGEKGYDVFASRAAAAGVRQKLIDQAIALGGGASGFAAFEVLRVEAGRPRYGVDFDEQILPAEVYESAGLMSRAVSFTKGCYTGQEVVVRIAHRGHVNRLLRGLLLGDAPLPVARTALYHAGTEKEVGWTTSGVESPRMGQTIAMGFVRREIELGGQVVVGPGGPVATVVGLPFEPTG